MGFLKNSRQDNCFWAFDRWMFYMKFFQKVLLNEKVNYLFKKYFSSVGFKNIPFLSFLNSKWRGTSPKRSQRWRSTLLNALCQDEEGMRIAGRVMAGASPCGRHRVKSMILWSFARWGPVFLLTKLAWQSHALPIPAKYLLQGVQNGWGNRYKTTSI